MITTISQDSTTSRYKNYDDLFYHIFDQIHKKLKEPEGSDKAPWSFSIYSQKIQPPKNRPFAFSQERYAGYHQTGVGTAAMAA